MPIREVLFVCNVFWREEKSVAVFVAFAVDMRAGGGVDAIETFYGKDLFS